jgi:hypothetical protein
MNLLAAIALLLVFALSRKTDRCEHPECERCPFPRCKRD